MYEQGKLQNKLAGEFRDSPAFYQSHNMANCAVE